MSFILLFLNFGGRHRRMGYPECYEGEKGWHVITALFPIFDAAILSVLVVYWIA